MRQIFPAPADAVDTLARYLADDRPARQARPWVMLNMIATIDGSTAIEGRSGGLGGASDREVFRAVRACADWILVASATAAAERYRSPASDPDVAAARRAHGRGDAARLAVVTASGRVDPSIPAVAARAEGADPVLVITGRAADLSGLDGADVEIVVTDEPQPSPAGVLSALAARGAEVVLCEGGPTWNGHLAQADVIDELCITLSPTLVGGDSPRIVRGAVMTEPTPMHLDRLLEQDGFLFARYVRQ